MFSFQILVLLLVNAIKRSLSIELMSFFEHVSNNAPCSKQAFSKQRRKLKPEFFHDWNQRLTASFYTHYEYCNWKGFRILAIDGSSVILPDTEAMRAQYSYTTNQTNHGSALARILENSLMLFDRGYLSYWLIYELLQRNTHFVMRAANNANNVIKAFLSGEEQDVTLDFYPPYSSLKKLRDKGRDISKWTPVKIRLVKIVLETGETEVLVTNLHDTTLYTIKDLKEVYHLRWGIETYYGYIKEELQLGVFSGISPICIEQDFAANLFLFNLQSIIEKQCEPYTQKVSSNRKYQNLFKFSAKHYSRKK